MKKNNKIFNLIITGVGGQGLITLLQIIARAALIEGFDVKTSELHGLSQRGGSVETHIRFGPSTSSGQAPSASLGVNIGVFSPLVRQGGADLVIALEFQEAFRACYYGSNEKTVFLINNYVIPILTDGKPAELLQSPAEFKNFSKKAILVPATKMVEEKFQNPVLAGIFLLGVAAFKNLISLKPESIIKAIREVVSPKYSDLNKNAFYLAQKY